MYRITILSWTIWRCPSFCGVRVPCLIELFPACHLAAIYQLPSSDLAPSSGHLHNKSRPAVSPWRSTSGISSMNHQDRLTSGPDWTQVNGRPTGSSGLRLTAAYSLSDPEMTASFLCHFQKIWTIKSLQMKKFERSDDSQFHPCIGFWRQPHNWKKKSIKNT